MNKILSFIAALYLLCGAALAQVVNDGGGISNGGVISGAFDANGRLGLGGGAILNVTLATDLNQVTGGSKLLPFSSTTGAYIGQYVTGTSIPALDQVASIVSAAPVTRNATGSFLTGQPVIP